MQLKTQQKDSCGKLRHYMHSLSFMAGMGLDIYKTKPSKSTLRSKLKRLNSPSINKPLHDKEFSFRQVKFIWKLKCRMGGTKSFSDIGSVPYQQAESWVGCSQQTSSTPPILVPNESSCYLGNKTIPGFEIFT